MIEISDIIYILSGIIVFIMSILYLCGIFYVI